MKKIAQSGGGKARAGLFHRIVVNQNSTIQIKAVILTQEGSPELMHSATSPHFRRYLTLLCFVRYDGKDWAARCLVLFPSLLVFSLQQDIGQHSYPTASLVKNTQRWRLGSRKLFAVSWQLNHTIRHCEVVFATANMNEAI